jgi:hypothetical protein
VLFEWHSLDHVALQESHAAFQPKHRYFDYLHVNSIAPSEDGNILVSARNTWAIYKIDRGSGAVIWRLGGKTSDFQMGPGTQFAWQHDARPHAGGLLSLFDDGAAPKVQPESRGLVLALDTVRMRATLLRAYPHSPPVLAFALGNVQLLPNGNVLVGYGTASRLTEFSADGTPLLDLRLPENEVNYRGFRYPWIGRAPRPPAARARPDGPVRELERRHRGERVGAPDRPGERAAPGGGDEAPGRVRDRLLASRGSALRRRGRARPRGPAARRVQHCRALTGTGAGDR